VRPHRYCLPVLKAEAHRAALLTAATSGNPKFFLGTDSAPHVRGRKECACGAAGCFTALHALELYAAAFESRGAIHMLQGFACEFGADFYGLPRNAALHSTLRTRLVRTPQVVPDAVPLTDTLPPGGAGGGSADEVVVPLCAGEELQWTASLITVT
jgi:dihydroorotase